MVRGMSERLRCSSRSAWCVNTMLYMIVSLAQGSVWAQQLPSHIENMLGAADLDASVVDDFRTVEGIPGDADGAGIRRLPEDISLDALRGAAPPELSGISGEEPAIEESFEMSGRRILLFDGYELVVGQDNDVRMIGRIDGVPVMMAFCDYWPWLCGPDLSGR